MKRKSYKFQWDEVLGRLQGPPEFKQEAPAELQTCIEQLNSTFVKDTRLLRPKFHILVLILLLLGLAGYIVSFVLILRKNDSLGVSGLCVTPFGVFLWLVYCLHRRNRLANIHQWSQQRLAVHRYTLQALHFDVDLYFHESTSRNYPVTESSPHSCFKKTALAGFVEYTQIDRSLLHGPSKAKSLDRTTTLKANVSGIQIRKIRLEDKVKEKDEELPLGESKKPDTLADLEKSFGGFLEDKDRGESTFAPGVATTQGNRLVPKFEYRPFNSKTSIQEEKTDQLLGPEQQRWKATSLVAAEEFGLDEHSTHRELELQFTGGEKEARSPTRALTEREQRWERHLSGLKSKAASNLEEVIGHEESRSPDPSPESLHEVHEEHDDIPKTPQGGWLLSKS